MRHLITAHAPSITVFLKDYCIVLHQSASRSRPNTLRSTSRLAEGFSALPRCSYSISHQYCLSGSLIPQALSRILRSQTVKLHDHVPGSLSLLTTDIVALIPVGHRRSTWQLSNIQGLSRHWRSTVSYCGPSYSDRPYPVLLYLLLLSFILPIASWSHCRSLAQLLFAPRVLSAPHTPA